MLISFGGVETACYWPDEIDVAEGRLPFAPVRPSGAVQRFTNLALAQVLLTTGAGPHAGKPVRGITYIFGSIPGRGGDIPDPVPPEPKFVVVHELPGAWHTEPQLHRTAYHRAKVGSAERWTVYGNWKFFATLPGGSEHLVVTANFGEDVIEAIGRAII
jgi:hypothetical protein